MDQSESGPANPALARAVRRGSGLALSGARVSSGSLGDVIPLVSVVQQEQLNSNGSGNSSSSHSIGYSNSSPSPTATSSSSLLASSSSGSGSGISLVSAASLQSNRTSMMSSPPPMSSSGISNSSSSSGGSGGGGHSLDHEAPRPRLRTEDNIKRSGSGAGSIYHHSSTGNNHNHNHNHHPRNSADKKHHRTFGVEIAKVLKREEGKIPLLLECLVETALQSLTKDTLTAPYWLKLFLASTESSSLLNGDEDAPVTEFVSTILNLRDTMEKQTSAYAVPDATPAHHVLALIQLYLSQLPKPLTGTLLKDVIESGGVTDFFLEENVTASASSATLGLPTITEPPLSPRGQQQSKEIQEKLAQSRASVMEEWKVSLVREAYLAALHRSIPQQNMSILRYLLRFLHTIAVSHDRRLLHAIAQRYSVVLLDRDSKGRVDRHRDAFVSEKATHENDGHSVKRDIHYINDIIMETLILFVDDLFPSFYNDVTKQGKMLIRKKDGEWGVVFCVLSKSVLQVHPDEHTSEPLLSINLLQSNSWETSYTGTGTLGTPSPSTSSPSVTTQQQASAGGAPSAANPNSVRSNPASPHGSLSNALSGSSNIAVRLVDDSLFGVENCFCIEAQTSRYSERLFDADSVPESKHLTKYYFVAESIKERHHWIEELRAAMVTSQSLRHVTSLELGLNALVVDKSSPVASQLLSPTGKNMFYCNILFDNELQARTFSKYDKEGNVEWMAQFHFDDVRHSFFDMSIVIWRMGMTPKEKDVEIGRITLPFHALAEKAQKGKENLGSGGNWFPLETGIGKIRIEIRYMVERICPLQTYNPMFMFLINTLNADRKTVNLVYEALNGDSTAHAKNEFAGSLVRFFMGIGLVTKFLRTLTRCEIFSTEQPTIIFRGNTMATKAMDQFMKICCEDYLHETLDEVAYDMFLCNQSCEVDPSLMEKGEDLMKNWRRLKGFIDRVCKCIFDSAPYVPRDLVIVLEGIRDAMAEKFGEADANKGLTAVSGFIFLRLFSAALQGPHLHPFYLVPDVPEEKSRRLFTIVSKTMQTLANLRLFSQKEEHLMNTMNTSFEEDKVLDKMKKFLADVANVYLGPRSPNDPPPAPLGSGAPSPYDAPVDVMKVIPLLKNTSVFVSFPPNHSSSASSTIHTSSSLAGVGIRVDIERELAYIFHHLVKKRAYLERKCEANPALKPMVDKLFALLNEVQAAEQRIVDEASRQGISFTSTENAFADDE